MEKIIVVLGLSEKATETQAVKAIEKIIKERDQSVVLLVDLEKKAEQLKAALQELEEKTGDLNYLITTKDTLISTMENTISAQEDIIESLENREKENLGKHVSDVMELEGKVKALMEASLRPFDKARMADDVDIPVRDGVNALPDDQLEEAGRRCLKFNRAKEVFVCVDGNCFLLLKAANGHRANIGGKILIVKASGQNES